MDITKGLRYATVAHLGQTRRGTGEDYVEHVKRVSMMASWCGMSADAQVAALLHDVIEDCPGHTLAGLRASGFSERVVVLTGLLTKPTVADRAVRMQVYYDAILCDPEAVSLKILDRTDNLQDARRLIQSDRAFAQHYLDKTEAEFLPLVEACDNVRALGLFDKALLDLIHELTGPTDPRRV